jgi:hypothetical protein
VDAASETLRVRLEVPNPDGRPAGERVFIRFDEEVQKAEPTKESLSIRVPGQENG